MDYTIATNLLFLGGLGLRSGLSGRSLSGGRLSGRRGLAMGMSDDIIKQ